MYGTKTDIILVFFGFMAATLSGLAMPAFTIYFGKIFDNIKDRDSVIDTNSTIMACIGVLMLFTASIYNLFLKTSRVSLTNGLKRLIYRAILNRDHTFWNQYKPNEITQFIDAEVAYYSRGVHENIGKMVMTVSSGVGGMAVAFFYSWKLSLIFLGCLIVFALFIIVFGHFIQQASASKSESVKKSGGILEEVFYSIKTVFYLRASEYMVDRYSRQSRTTEEWGVFIAKLTGVMVGFFILLFDGYMIAGFTLGDYYIRHGIDNLTVGDVMIVMFNVLPVTFALSEIGTRSVEITDANTHLKTLYNIIEYKNKIDIFEDNPIVELNEINIKVQNVYFKYTPNTDEVNCNQVPENKDNCNKVNKIEDQQNDSLKNVLDDISLSITNGQTVAFVGESGSGKSTLVKMFSRFYDPLEGSISVNNVDLRSMNLRQLRKSVGYVNQDPVFFNMSLRDNMNLSGVLRDSEIVEMLTKVQLDNWLSQQPNGLDVDLGTLGGKLSGGQKQRLALARVLLNNQLKLLILDEATAALDYDTEYHIYQTIFDFQKILNFTCIIVAHRLKSIKKADKIVVLSKGKLIEFGTHNQLINNQNGLYYSLVNSQENKSSDENEPNRVNKQNFDAIKSKNVMKSVAERDLEKNVQNLKDKGAFFCFNYLLNLNKENVVYLVFGLISATLKGCADGLLGYLFANMILTIATEEFDTWMLRFLYYVVIVFFLESFRYIFMGIYSEKLISKLRVYLMKNILLYQLVYLETDEYSPGNISSMFATDVEKVRIFGGEFIGTVIYGLLTICCGWSLSFYFCWQISLLMIACIPLIIAGAYKDANDQKSMFSGESSEQVLNKDAMLLSESCVNWMTTQSLNGEQVLTDRYNQYMQLYDEPIATLFNRSLLYGLSNAQVFWIYAAGFWYQNYLNEHNSHYTISDTNNAMFSLLLSVYASSLALASFADYTNCLNAVKRMYSITENKDRFQVDLDASNIKDDEFGDIEFQDVYFRYNPTLPYVFNGLNLKIHKNKFNAFVGYSGGGKSTLLNLMLKLYTPEKGTISINGVDIKHLNGNSILNCVGYVGQDSVMFDETIEDNLNIGLIEKLTNDQIKKIMDEVNSKDFYPRDGALGLKGSHLSGGQRQRMAIARALGRNRALPRILILDEATAALDGKNEEEVQKILNRILEREDCTLIVVAHRLSTIRNAFNINVLANGQLLESGTHDELINMNNGIYKGMLNA